MEFSAECERLKALFESHGVPMLLLDALEGKVVYANAAAGRLWGHPPERFLGLTAQDLFGAHAPRVLSAEQGLSPVELTVRLPSGEERILEIHACAVRVEDRPFSFCLVVDVTSRKTVEEALKATQHRYRLLEELFSDVIWIADDSLRLTYVSPSILQQRGYTPEEALHQRLTEMVTPSSLPTVTEFILKWKEFTESGGVGFTHRMEVEQPTKGGGTIWVDVIVKQLVAPDGTRLGVMGICRDITEMKRQQSELLASKRRLEAQNEELRTLKLAIEQSANTVIITDRHGTILYVNPRFEQTSGYRADEAIGKNPRLLKSGLMDRAFYQRLWETISSGKVWTGEFHNRRKDGSLYWEAATISPVFNEAGEITHYVAIKEDVTLRKSAEEALKRYAEELQAQNAELDAFAHTVAHDLKGPLGALVGFAELAMESADMSKEELDRILRQVVEIGWQMNRILDALLLLSATRSKKVDIVPLDMGEIVSSAIQRLKPLVDSHHAHIQVPGEWPPALGYAPWVEEVWVNYLSNAVKYGGRPPRVEVGGVVAGDKVKYWVRDNGRGIPPEAQARLFTPFTRLRQVSVEGHGLGLSIVRRIVERLGGEVGVESRDGEGSTFFFTLPAPSAPEKPGTGPHQAGS